MSMTEKIADALFAYQALSPEERAKHDYSQRRSFVRGMCPSNQDFGEWCKVVDLVIPPVPNGQS